MWRTSVERYGSVSGSWTRPRSPSSRSVALVHPRFLDQLCCNHIPREPGRIAVAPALTATGGVECDLTVTCVQPDHYYVVGAAAAEDHDVDWLNRHAPRDGTVHIKNVTEERAVLTVAGPRSREVLAELTDADLSNAAFPWMRARSITIEGVSILALRVSYVGELGWELHMPMAALPDIYQGVLGAGASHGIVDFGYRALESMRMEKGYRLWGSDLDTEHTALEAGLAPFVRLDKGSFVGRGALLDQTETGLARRLTTLIAECDDAIPLRGDAIRDSGTVDAYVSAAERGHVVGKVIVHAYLPVDRAEVGTTYEIDVLGRWLPATVVNGPLFDPANTRLRS